MQRREVLLSVGASAALAAIPAFAQRQSKRRLGLLLLVSVPSLTDPLFRALGEKGWRLGANLEIETRITAPQQQRAVDMAKELLGWGADILVTVSTANALAARQASSNVPIVMLASGYPVESGLAASYARPGGNVTGLSIYAGSALFGKHVEVTRELVPSLRQLGVFWGYAPPAFPQIETDLALGEMQAAGTAMNVKIRAWFNRDEASLEANLAAAANSGIDALFVSAGGPQSQPKIIERIVRFVLNRRLPTACDAAGVYFMQGGLVAYSADFAELGTRAAAYADRILRGDKPAGMPIEQPTRFELVVNRKFAKALGFAIPHSLVLRADRFVD